MFSEHDTAYVLAHEIMHVVLGHHWRLHKECKLSRELANIVADYEVERSLRSLEQNYKIRMPRIKEPGEDKLHDLALRCPQDLENYSAEEIFRLLYKRQPPPPPQGGDGTQDGASDDSTNPNSQGTSSKTGTGTQDSTSGSANNSAVSSTPGTTLADLLNNTGPHGWVPVQDEKDAQKVRELLTEAVAQAQALDNLLRTFEQSKKDAQGRGNYPGFLESAVDIYLRSPTQDWRQVLRDWITDTVHVRLNWTKPAKQTWATGTYTPKRNRKDPSAIVLARDTSGSMDNTTLGRLTSEILGICDEFDGELQYLAIDIDTQIRGYVLTRSPFEVEQFFRTARGRGGTDYQLLWETVKALDSGTSNLVHGLDTNIVGVVMLTDFETDYADLNPDTELPVLWVSHKKLPRGRTVRGTVITIPKQEEEY
jgi:hypothetical protein